MSVPNVEELAGDGYPEPPSLLQCAICLESYDSSAHQPKLLPCHHSFCKQCLVNLVNSHNQIPCPTCRERALVMSPPPYGVSRLQTNFYITQMKDYLSQDVKTKDCRKHDNNSLTLFCQTCEVLVCATCKLQDHKQETGHNVLDLETAKREQTRLLEVEMATSQQKMLECMTKTKTYNTELINLGTAKSKAIQDIDKAFNRYVEVVNDRRQELKDEVAGLHADRNNALLQGMEVTKVMSTSLSALVDQVKDTVSNGTISDLMAYKAKLTAKNQEIREEQNTLPQIEPNFIRFDTNEAEFHFLDVVHNLGSIKVTEHVPCKVKVTNTNAIASLFANITVVVMDINGQELENYPITIDIIDKYNDIIPSMLQYSKHGQYEVTFKPEVSGLHKVQVRFLDQIISGGSFALEVRSNDPLSTIGGREDEAIEMEFPRSVAVDRQNNLYVVDTGNNRIQKFNKAGQYMSKLTISSEAEVYSSCGLAIDEIQGTLICPEVCVQEADLSEASAVLVYSLDGELLHRYVYRDIMRRALSVAVDSASHMIIADYELNTVFVFDKSGRLLRKFGEPGSGPGHFNNPTFLCIGENNNIIVSDGNNHRIQVFDWTGKFLYQFGCRGSGKGQLNMPFGVTADYHGNLLVVDGGNKRVQIFKSDGEFLGCIESLGDGLNAPRGIAVTSDGYALVADRDNHCVKKFKYLHCTSL